MESTSRQIDSLRQQVADLQQQLESLRNGFESDHDANERARLQAESELQHTFGLLQAVMDGAQDAIYIKDRQGRYLIINDAGARFLSTTPDVVIGKTDFDLFSRPTAEVIANVDRQIMREGSVQTIEQHGDVGDEHRWYSSTKAPYRDKDGSIVGVIGISRDVTQSVQASQALAHSKRENELLLEAIPDMLMRVDRDGTYLSFKYPSGFVPWQVDEHVVGMSVFDSVPLNTAKQVMSLIKRALETGVSQDMVVTLPTDEGDVHRDVRIIRAADNEVLIIIRDVTQRRNAEQQRDEYYRLTDAIRRIQAHYISPHVADSDLRCDTSGVVVNF